MDTRPKIYVGGHNLGRAGELLRELQRLGYQLVSRLDVQPGDRISAALDRLLDSTTLAIVFPVGLTFWANESVDQDEEILALVRAMKRNVRVVPVMSDVDRGSMPTGFRDLEAIRMRTFTAADKGFKRLLGILPGFNSQPEFAVREPSRTSFGALSTGPFRCFGNAGSDLECGDSRWTVILGDNGSGKTTLLRLLASFASNSGLARGLSCPAIATLAFGNGSEGQFLVRPDERERMASLLPDCIGYGAGRGTRLASLVAGDTDPCLTLFDDAGTLPDPEEWLLQTDYAAKLEQAAPGMARRRDEVLRVLVDLLPDVEELRFEAHQGRTRVEALTLDGWIPMRDLSFGYRTAMTWVVDLARRLFDRYPESDNPLAETAVVLVDEIDLHLHPRWQRHLLSLLDKTFPKCQFIVTAHSPLIVQAAPDANIVLLRREKDGVVIDNHRDHIRKWRVDQILASELFGEQPTHSPEAQALLDRRTAILAKPELTESDHRELAALREQARTFDAATLPEDLEALDLIQEASKALLK